MKRLVLLPCTVALVAGVSLSACSDDNNATATATGGGAAASATGAGGSTSASGFGGSGGFDPTGSGGGTGNCDPDSAPDADNDGFTETEGDCNDCDANVNPGAIEVQTDANDPEAQPFDENCDGVTDEPILPCDGGIALDDFDAFNGAKAIDLCNLATPGGKDFGVLEANYVRADGSVVSSPTAQVGIQNTFGDNVSAQRGSQMLLISSGYARTPGQANACDSYDCQVTNKGNAPGGFPQKVPKCGGGKSVNDDIGLEVRLRAPTNATGYRFQFKFYSFEYAEYVCTEFNDQFITLVSPAPAGAKNGNISFDSANNPVSVNIAFFDVCDSSTLANYAQFCTGMCPQPPNPYCPSGPSELVGTGFEPSWGQDAGGTSWLTTTAPINGSEEADIRFTIWDTEDQIWDSSAVIDAFEWIADPGQTVTVETVPTPK